MRIPRLYLDLPLSPNTTHSLPEQSFHYLCKVLRFKQGYVLKVFNGDGRQYNATLLTIEKRHALIHVTDAEALHNESPIKVTIGQCLSRGERMDYAIQKAVEAGVYAIQPLFSERCEVKLDEERADKRLQHWQHIAISAAEQSGRAYVPAILPPIKLEDWVENCKDLLKLTLHHHSHQPIRELMAPTDNAVSVLIGPEGGLSEEEVDFSINQGFKPVALGPRVLRTETAPIVALSAIQLLWGDIR
jgi:16S rRNA (uracil1498-N3)-methyltransferase